jgi:hypothetical protein
MTDGNFGREARKIGKSLLTGIGLQYDTLGSLWALGRIRRPKFFGMGYACVTSSCPVHFC